MELVSNVKLILPYPQFTFIVVGGGGNGSYLVPNLARIISITNKKYNRNDNMIIIDGDEIEEKNIARQNFVLPDVGKNKAKVLASRYSRAFGVPISSVEEYLTKDNYSPIFSLEYPNNQSGMIIMIGCVDNNKTRHLLQDIYKNTPFNMAWIDAGNEEYGGQVVFTTNKAMAENGTTIHFKRYGAVRIKDVVDEFTLDNNDKHPSDLSCAERAVSSPQNIGTNIKAADIVFDYCNLIIAGAANYVNSPDRNDIMNNRRDYLNQEEASRALIKRAPMIGNHIVYFDSRTGQTSAQPFSPEVQEYIKKMARLK